MKWPESNVGIATGDGLIILDVDGPDGRESLKEFSSLPPTITATTPRADGGMQFYFSADEELEEVAKNRVQLLPGLDIRAAGGYVVAPPSSLDPYDKNPEGGEYTWVDYSSPEDVDLAPAPDWLRELLVTGHRAHGQKQVAPRKTATETTRYGEVALQRECAELSRTSEPGRNNQLNEAAFSIGRLVAGGEIVEAEARQALTAAADDCRLIADDGERQVQATLNSGLSSGMKEPRAAPEAQERLAEEQVRLLKDRTDSGNAEILAHFHGEDLRYDHGCGRWIVWRGNRWEEDADGEPPRMVRDVALWRQKNAYHLEDDDLSKKVYSYAIQTRNATRIKAALAMAESTYPIADKGEGWDERPDLLAVANGVIDLRTCTLRNGRREDRLTMHVPHLYDPEATCPRWQRFLSEIFRGDKELIEHVRRAVGYSLTGEQSEQCWWLLHGSGRNGKSTFLETLQHVFGPSLAWSTGFSTFAARPGTSGHSEDVANLEYKRLVTASETAEGTKLNEARIKALTGGDRINASAKYAHERVFQPQLSLWLGVNHLPTVTDDSYAFWRRVRFLPFLQRFRPRNEQEEGDLPEDQDVKATLQAEAAGILAWAVEGCRAWREDGLTKPTVVTEAVEKYRRASDPIAAFLEDRTAEDPEAFTPTAELYYSYQSWADWEGIPDGERLTHKAFGSRMKDRFDDARRRVNGRPTRGFVGVRMEP
jgi:putative DNA primase/helicase